MDGKKKIAELGYVTRAGLKLEHALREFEVDVSGLLCADLGSHQGGFVDCLLKHGAAKVYSIDTSYGTLAWELRNDPRVEVMERTNALHAELPETVDLVTVDVGWTPQRHIVPAALRMLNPEGRIISLVKPQYESRDNERSGGILKAEYFEQVMERVRLAVETAGARIVAETRSPIKGGHGNIECLMLLSR